MSVFYFCPACGNNLTYISNRRLKCYKCGKYFTENLICRCQRDRAFKYSAEITAPNKVKCFFCGREAQVPANLDPPYIDQRRGGSEINSPGSWREVIRSRSSKKTRQKISVESGKPEIDYISEDRDQIIIMFPGHNSLDQIRCEIIDGILEVQSSLVDFLEKFPMPNFPSELKTSFRNSILEIRLIKKGAQ